MGLRYTRVKVSSPTKRQSWLLEPHVGLIQSNFTSGFDAMSKKQTQSGPETTTRTADPSASAPSRALSWVRDESVSLEIRPAPQQRDWMNETEDRLAYRCAPLNTANTHGWEILNPVPFFAIWNGGNARSDVALYHDESDGELIAGCGFGHGLLSFGVKGPIRTEPGYDLYVSGPVNNPKPNIHAMAGIVETDWSLHGISVTWKFIRPNELVHFKKGEPFCSFFPIQRGLIETFDPRFLRPEQDPGAWTNNRRLVEDRLRWNEAVQVPGSKEKEQLWDRNYLRGPEDSVDPPHRIRTRVKPFKEQS